MEVSCWIHALADLPPGKNPSTQWIGGWVGLRTGLDAVAKRKNRVIAPAEPRSPSSWAIHYTDWATPAPYRFVNRSEFSVNKLCSSERLNYLVTRNKFRKIQEWLLVGWTCLFDNFTWKTEVREKPSTAAGEMKVMRRTAKCTWRKYVRIQNIQDELNTETLERRQKRICQVHRR